MNLDGTKARLLNAALERYADELRTASEANAAATFDYTHCLHRPWRARCGSVELPPAG